MWSRWLVWVNFVCSLGKASGRHRRFFFAGILFSIERMNENLSIRLALGTYSILIAIDKIKNVVKNTCHSWPLLKCWFSFTTTHTQTNRNSLIYYFIFVRDHCPYGCCASSHVNTTKFNFQQIFDIGRLGSCGTRHTAIKPKMEHIIKFDKRKMFFRIATMWLSFGIQNSFVWFWIRYQQSSSIHKVKWQMAWILQFSSPIKIQQLILISRKNLVRVESMAQNARSAQSIGGN